jgi:hypothetical protein
MLLSNKKVPFKTFQSFPRLKGSNRYATKKMEYWNHGVMEYWKNGALE